MPIGTTSGSWKRAANAVAPAASVRRPVSFRVACALALPAAPTFGISVDRPLVRPFRADNQPATDKVAAGGQVRRTPGFFRLPEEIASVAADRARKALASDHSRLSTHFADPTLAAEIEALRGPERMPPAGGGHASTSTPAANDPASLALGGGRDRAASRDRIRARAAGLSARAVPANDSATKQAAPKRAEIPAPARRPTADRDTARGD